MTRKTGFFKAFFGCCCGRDIFYTLRQHSWGRTLFHLFLLSLITGCLIGHFRNDRSTALLDAAESVFTELFGTEICVSDSVASWNWICPVKDPLKPREMALPGGGRFYYTGSSRQVPESLKQVSGTAMVWSPDALGVSVPGPNGSGNCMVINTATGKMEKFSGTSSSLEPIFKKAPEKLPAPVEKMKKENVRDLFTVVAMLVSFFTTCGTVLWNFFITLLYTGIFIGMYRLLNGPSGRLRFLTLGEMWKCGIYAAFPPMAIASLFPILELPLISYETVFMIGLLIYWMAVTAKLERTPSEDEENNANQ